MNDSRTDKDMGSHLTPNGSFGEYLRDVGLSKIDDAERLLRSDREHREEAVHETRKILKAMRALLRLVRENIGEEAFKRENVAYRDIGRTLARARNDAVAARTLDKLLKHGRGEADRDDVRAIDHTLERRMRKTSDRLFDNSDLFTTVLVQLDARRDALRELPVHDAFPTAALARQYDRARRQMVLAYRRPAERRFHEWRKQVKYLWNQIAVLMPVWPEGLSALDDRLHQLSDMLGDAHDLAMLRDTLEHLKGRRRSRRALRKQARSRRAGLRSAALRLGREVFREPPDAFARRIASAWTAWRDIDGHDAASANGDRSESDDDATHATQPNGLAPPDSVVRIVRRAAAAVGTAAAAGVALLLGTTRSRR